MTGGARPPEAVTAELMASSVLARPVASTVVADWPAGVWLNQPEWAMDGDDVVIFANKGTDFWRHTSYGLIHDSGHAYLAPFRIGDAFEVDLHVNMQAQSDQAGIMVRQSSASWIKAGIEFLNDSPQLSAVVTTYRSNRRSRAVPDWRGQVATIRASRGQDSITIRVRRPTEPWELVRLCPMPGTAALLAGPYCCAPTRAHFGARFRRFALTHGDSKRCP